ncbi:MAG: hypothetical protein HY593_00180 [Candidatus Omnitrophica bacterium]|nr:hypothetical protein [Candidatus Omnitrophota bacterium]
MIEVIYKKEYLKSFDSLSRREQELVLLADEEIREYCRTGKASYGLRVKKLHHAGDAQIFEARISLALRILWARERNRVSFILAGDHDAVSRFLRNL